MRRILGGKLSRHFGKGMFSGIARNNVTAEERYNGKMQS